MTPFSDTFVGAKINNVYTSKTTPGTPVMVNATVQLTENAEHLRSSVKQDVQKQLTGALQRRNNNVGTSGLWVDSPAGAISQLHGNDRLSFTASPQFDFETISVNPSAFASSNFSVTLTQCPYRFRRPAVSSYVFGD
jgi:hypothetical protein